MARINLYVDNDLEQRMRPFRATLSWSRIAQRAFEAAIKEAEAGATDDLRSHPGFRPRAPSRATLGNMLQNFVKSLSEVDRRLLSLEKNPRE